MTPVRELFAGILVMAGCVFSGCSNAPISASTGARVASRPSDLRIGTYNVYVGSRDFARTAAVIRAMNVDVLALQEVKPGMAAALEAEFRHEYRHRSFSNGLGLMSRLPTRHTRFQRSAKGINGFAFAEIQYRGRPIQIVNVHLDPLRLWTFGGILTLPSQIWWRHPAIQRAELGQMAGGLRKSMPLILAGDFNRVGDGAIEQVLAWGLVDSASNLFLRADHIPTLNLNILGLRVGRRIDFIFHDPALDTIDATIVSGRPSDHDAVVSVLRWKSSRAEDGGKLQRETFQTAGSRYRPRQ